MRERQRTAAAVIIKRAGGPAEKFWKFFEKVSQCRKNCRTVPKKLSHSAKKIVAQCRKRIIPYLCLLPNTIGSCSKLKNFRQPIRNEYYVIRAKHPSNSSANQNRVLRHPSRQLIRIEHYITRVVITSPESSRLGWRYLLGSRLESARYSLS